MVNTLALPVFTAASDYCVTWRPSDLQSAWQSALTCIQTLGQSEDQTLPDAVRMRITCAIQSAHPKGKLFPFLAF